MFTVTVAHTAQGYIAAASEAADDTHSTGCSGFCDSPEVAASEALRDLRTTQSGRAERARDWAAAQAPLPLDARLVPSSLVGASETTRRMYAFAGAGI